MECFHDFCLACDKTPVNGPYCSQACRLLDLEKANAESSPPTSPRNSAHPRWSSSTTSTSGYMLTPAYNFEQDRHRDSYFMRSPASKSSETSNARMLSPSSSRTSLSSTSSTTTSPTGMSEQAKAQLNTYFASFDKVRAARRRSSLR